MNPFRTFAALPLATLIALPALAAPAQTTPPERQTIYSGAPAQSAALANGALINAGYLQHGDRSGAAEIVNVRDGLWVLRNYSIVNCIIAETPQGLVVMDSGTNRGDGKIFLDLIRSRTDKPVLAIIYSHNHYTGGAKALMEGAGIPAPLIIGHPDLEQNFREKSLTMRPSITRRANMQFGKYLPKQGEDAGLSPPSALYANAADRVPQHVPVTKAVADGESLTIGGLLFQFYHAEGDTTDTLIVHIPAWEAVITNVTSQQFFAISTLRGQPYRDPRGIIASYAKVRDLAPAYYVPTHGAPLVGKQAINQRMQIHHDAYNFTYNQTLRGINNGWSPDEIVDRTPLPERFRAEPTLFESYSGYEFALRGIYSGLMGWFAEDTTELFPPSRSRGGQEIVKGFGGREKLLAAARAAQQRREYNIAALLAGYAVYADPADQDARQVKAAALRAMARITTGSQAHNFFLTEALELEGKINTDLPPAIGHSGFGFATVANAPAATLVSVLESHLRPDAARGINASFTVHFTDVNERYTIALRDSVAEVSPASAASPTAGISLPRETWFNLFTGRMDIVAAKKAGATLQGLNAEQAQKWINLFDPF